jgi:hypothetical protein
MLMFYRITIVYLQETFNMELTGLSSDIEYEVRLRAMNSQGWSQLSNPFLFRTAGTGQNPSPILLKNGRYRSKAFSNYSQEQQGNEQPGLEPALQSLPL